MLRLVVAIVVGMLAGPVWGLIVFGLLMFFQ